MRLTCARPIDLLQHLVTEHLVVAWPHPDDMKWMYDASSPVAIKRIYADPDLTVPMTGTGWSKRVQCGSNNPAQRGFTIVASVGGTARGDAVLLLTDTMEPVLAMQTDTMVQGNVVNLKSDQVGIALLPANVLQQRNFRGIVPGTTTLSWLQLERFDQDGWVPAAGETITVPDSAKPIRVDLC